MRRARFEIAIWSVAMIALTIVHGCSGVGRRFSNERGGRFLQHVPYGVGESLPVLNEDSPIEDYLTYAERNNPGLRAAFDQWQAALQEVPQAKSLPDPRFGYAYFANRPMTPNGPMRHRLSLSQEFPFYGKRSLQAQQAEREADAARLKYIAASLDLFYRVQDALYEYWYIGQALDVVKANIDLLTALEEVVRSRYATGAAPESDLLKLHVELGKLANEKASLEDLLGPSRARLNAVLNRPVDSPLPIPRILRQSPEQIDPDAALQSLLENNPQLQSLSAEIERAELDVSLSRKEYFPDIMLGVEYTIVGEAERPMPLRGTVSEKAITIPGADVTTAPPVGELPHTVSIPARQVMLPAREVMVQPMKPKDSGMDDLMVMISVNVPIWYGRLNAAVAQAESRLHAAIHEKKEKENDLVWRLKMAVYKYRDSTRQMSLYRDTLIPRAEQSLRSSQAAYMTGKGTFADLIDVERMLLEFNLSHRRAEADRLRYLAEVEALVGRRLSDVSSISEETTEGGGVPASVSPEGEKSEG